MNSKKTVPIKTLSTWAIALVLVFALYQTISHLEQISYAQTSSLQGDINADCLVNSVDWSLMNSKWFTNDAKADLNHDGLVNSIDFSLLNKNWFLYLDASYCI